MWLRVYYDKIPQCTMAKRRKVQDAISVDYGLRFTYSANRSLGV